jgi:hypothetical protein
VENIAEEFVRPISKVEQMLSTAAHQLEQGTHIKDFISVLAIKQVKDLLRPSRHTSPRAARRAFPVLPRKPLSAQPNVAQRAAFHMVDHLAVFR